MVIDSILIGIVTLFAGERKVLVGEDVYTADNVLIAVGGHPNWPKIPGSELGISSDGFFELEHLPKWVGAQTDDVL